MSASVPTSPLSFSTTPGVSLKIYDPAMCCSTGVCGTDVDPRLIKLAAFLKDLDPKKVTVERFNLAQQPEAYTVPEVAGAMKELGVDALPMVFVNGELLMCGDYPALEELSKALGVSAPLSQNDGCTPGGGCC